MKLEEQVLSVEQVEHLKELGVDFKDSAMCWLKSNSGKYFVAPISLVMHDDYIPTLTFQEILEEQLPSEIMFGYDRTFLIIDKADVEISYMREDYNGELTVKCICFDGQNMLSNAYHMLCWVIENGYLNKK